MQLDANLFAGKPPSLEEGPMRHQKPEAIIVNRTEIRTPCQRCIQILKVILYIELTLFIGWLGCVSLTNYYTTPKFTDMGVLHESPKWIDDSDDDTPSSDSIVMENDSPINDILMWRIKNRNEESATTNTDQFEATTEPIIEISKDLIEFEKYSPPTFSEPKESNLDLFLSQWLDTLATPEVPISDEVVENHPNKYQPIELFESDEPDAEGLTIIDNVGAEDSIEPFRSFEERWKKLRADIDENIEGFDASKDTSETSPLIIERFGDSIIGGSDESSLDANTDDFLGPLLSAIFLKQHELSFGESKEDDSSSDNVNFANIRFTFNGPEIDETDLLRFARDVGEDNSNSTSSSEEAAAAAPKVKRSTESSSGESDERGNKSESSESSSKESMVEKIFTKTPSNCLKIFDKDGKVIEDRNKIVDHIKKNLFKSLQEAPVPDCGSPNIPKTVKLNECGKFIITCDLPEIKNEISDKVGEEANQKR